MKLKAWANGQGRQVGEAEVDMTPFIGKADGRIRVHFPKCEFPNTYIECEFKASETDSSNMDDGSDEESKSFKTSGSPELR